MIYEVGKNRLECLGDVVETADLIEYYCDEFTRNNGYLQADGDARARTSRTPACCARTASSRSSRRSTSPSRSPAARPAPRWSPATRSCSSRRPTPPLMGVKFAEVCLEAGLPPGVFNFVTGPGRTAGQELIDNPGIDGIVFTGSMEVGMKLLTRQRRAADPAAGDHRDGRQEPGDHHRERRISTRRPTASGGRRSARRGRSAPPARASTSRKDVATEVRRPARREDEEDQGRQPAREGRLDGPGHQRRARSRRSRTRSRGRSATAARSSPAATGS